jgi:hypothetical protein
MKSKFKDALLVTVARSIVATAIMAAPVSLASAPALAQSEEAGRSYCFSQA